MDKDVFVDSLGFSLYVIIYSVYVLFSVNEESLISSLQTVLCFHFFLLFFSCESFQYIRGFVILFNLFDIGVMASRYEQVDAVPQGLADVITL